MSGSSETQTHHLMDHVHHLDSETMKPFLEDMGAVLLSVVMLPISKRCRKFVSEYQKIADDLKNLGITFAQINALGNGEVLAPFGISTFPHVMLFQGLDNFKEYRGAFREAELTSYINRFLDFPVLSEISTSTIAEFKRSSSVAVIGYIADGDTGSRKRFERLAGTMFPEYLFGLCSDPDLAKVEHMSMPGMAVYKASDEEKDTLHLEDDIDMMVSKLRKTARPLIVDLVFEIHEHLLDLGISFAYVFSDNAEERQRLRKEIEPLAREYRREILFGIADPGCVGQIVYDLHLNVTQFPAFAIREPTANLRYPMNIISGSFVDATRGFVQDYLDGKLQPTIKSEPLPGNTEAALVKVVGMSFNDLVLDIERDVLLTYCIDDCRPCEILQPTLMALAEVYSSSPQLKDKIRIAEIKYDANDTPERVVRAFPTIRLFPAKSKSKPLTYSGPRTMDDLADFIRDRGSHKGDLRHSQEKQIQS